MYWYISRQKLPEYLNALILLINKHGESCERESDYFLISVNISNTGIVFFSLRNTGIENFGLTQSIINRRTFYLIDFYIDCYEYCIWFNYRSSTNALLYSLSIEFNKFIWSIVRKESCHSCNTIMWTLINGVTRPPWPRRFVRAICLGVRQCEGQRTERQVDGHVVMSQCRLMSARRSPSPLSTAMDQGRLSDAAAAASDDSPSYLL